jgi:DNA-3-methyladenine glycosylase
MNNMLNIVTREKGYPAAILIRGVEGQNGPGRLTKEFHITRAQNGTSATQKSALWIEDRGVRLPPKAIMWSPRIGIDYAGKHWSGKPWRLSVK